MSFTPQRVGTRNNKEHLMKIRNTFMAPAALAVVLTGSLLLSACGPKAEEAAPPATEAPAETTPPATTEAPTETAPPATTEAPTETTPPSMESTPAESTPPASEPAKS
ncbi:MAG: hypothetical protein ABWX87_09075 [Pseudoxanthomonas sp.]|jgi:hypothetical protein